MMLGMHTNKGISRREFLPGALAAVAAAKSAWTQTLTAATSRPRPFRLIPLNTGECLLGKNHVLGDPYSDDERVPFTIYAFLADGGPGRRVLIDLGPVGLKYINDMFRRYRFFRDLPGDPDAIRQPHSNVFDWLKRLSLEPADINHIVFTHLHADHHGLTDARDGGAVMRFPRATVHVSRIGWQDNLGKRRDGQWNSYVDYAFADYLLADEQCGIVRFHDNDEVLSGMDVIHMGGHSPCSQAIRVQTDAGPVVIAGDEIYHYSLFERGILSRLYTTPEQQLAASNKLADLAMDGAILLPCHDPLLSKQYEQSGDAWLRDLAPISRRAARGFKASAKKKLPRSAAEG